MNATFASLLLSILLASCLVDASCTRKLDVRRKCLKKCKTNVDCKGRKKKCFCDGDCGMSCVRLNKKCKEVLSIIHGAVDIKPYNRFDSKARYSCDDGYTLVGPTVRVCRGDGKWDLTAPTCEIEGKCPPPPSVPFARTDSLPGRKFFNVGDRIYYSCEKGYDPEGFSNIACLDNGLWTGHTIKCNPKACPDPGYIENGFRHSGRFVFKSEVNFTCNEGYQLHGNQSLKCNSSGRWEGVKPHCLPIKCPLLNEPTNGEVTFWSGNTKYRIDRLISLKYGDRARFSCMRGFEIRGNRERICSANGKWSGRRAICTIVDCGHPGNIPHGMVGDGRRTTFGAKFEYRCIDRSTPDGHMTLECQENGEWDHQPPQCLKKCNVPRVRHANILTVNEDHVGNIQYFNHNDSVLISCEKGYSLRNHHKNTSYCNNGTWQKLPSCVPSPCSNRPPSLDDLQSGFMRFHSNKHGAEAKYECYSGFALVGKQTIKCERGRWVGNKPVCKPVKCEDPGEIKNGIVFVVGKMGKYKYEYYTNRTRHTDQLEFECNTGYKLRGPKGSTCINGKWSPDKKNFPKCIPKMHPLFVRYQRRRKSRRTLY